MPELSAYTQEQKAAAFDALWQSCGLGMGLLRDHVERDISPPGSRRNKRTVQRVPLYEFVILAVGDVRYFRDVLHLLATETQKGGAGGHAPDPQS